MKRHSTSSTKITLKNITVELQKSNPKLSTKWYEYLDRKSGAGPATIDFWIELANDPPELLGEGTHNFRIRDSQMVDKDEAKQVIDNIRAIMSSVAHLPPSAGYDTFDHSPLRLFLAVLETVPRGRIRCCIRCDRYFFAKRTDQKACSYSCANVARVTRYRERWRGYEQTRKNNRAAKLRREKLEAERRSRELKDRPR